MSSDDDLNPADGTPPSTRSRVIMRAALRASPLLAIGVGVTVLLSMGVLPAPAELQAFLESLPERFGPWTFAAFVGIGIAALMALAPSPFISGSAGAVFGFAVGLPIAIGMIVVAAALERTVAVLLAGERTRQQLAARFPEVDEAIRRRGLIGVALLRLVGTPTSPLAYASGFSRLPLRSLLIGILLGSTPRTLAYVALGANLGDLWPPTEWPWQVIVALILLVVLLSMTGLIMRRGGLSRPRDASATDHESISSR